MVNPTNKAARKSFGDKLRALRSALGITHTDLAKRAGLTIRFIGALEQGRVGPSIKSGRAIAKVLAELGPCVDTARLAVVLFGCAPDRKEQAAFDELLGKVQSGTLRPEERHGVRTHVAMRELVDRIARSLVARLAVALSPSRPSRLRPARLRACHPLLRARSRIGARPR